LPLIKTPRGATWALRPVHVLQQLVLAVHVVLPDNNGLAEQYRDAGAFVHILETDIARLKTPDRLFKTGRAFRELVRTLSPDIIHSHFVGTTLFMRLAMGREGPARVFQVPGPLHLENPITRRIEIASANQLDRWIASCKFTLEAYRLAGIRNERLGLSYYGLDLSTFKSHKPANLREQLGLPPDAAVIGMVAYIYGPKRWLGQTRGLKGHEDLIDAVKIITEHGREAALVFVGGPWHGSEAYARRLEHYARLNLGKRAIFLGHRTDVADLYAGFDLAVHPSHSENLGGAVESLALAVPTVATRVGGFPDIVIPGETGWLSPPKSPIALASTIMSALDDPEQSKRLARQGAERVRSILDVERNGREIADLYNLFTQITTSRYTTTNGALI